MGISSSNINLIRGLFLFSGIACSINHSDQYFRTKYILSKTPLALSLSIVHLFIQYHSTFTYKTLSKKTSGYHVGDLLWFFFVIILSSSPTRALLDDRTNNIYFRVRDLRIFIDTTIPIMPEIPHPTILSKQIRSLTLVSNKSFPESIFLRYLLSIVHPDTLRYLILQLDNCSNQFLFHLINQFPRLTSLTLSTYHSWSKLIQLSSVISSTFIRTLIVHEPLVDFNPFNSICQLFHSLECLSIVLATLDDCYRLLSLLFIGTRKSQFHRLRSLMIKCDFDEPDVVARWIRSNILRKFSYKCTTSILIIWLWWK